jgi:hypothetical protein
MTPSWVTQTRFARAACACLTIAAALALSDAPAGAAWSPFTNVVVNNYVSQPKVATDPAGNAVFMWERSDGGLYTRSRSADGTFSPVQTIDRSGFGGHDLAVDSQGNEYYLWEAFGDPGAHARARVRYADGTLSPVQTLATVPDPGERIGDPRVGVSASGRAVFGWASMRVGDGSVLETNLIQTRSRSASGKLSPVKTVARDELSFDMGVDAQGNATFAWEDHANAGVAEFTRVLDASGDLGPARRISRVGSKADLTPQVAVTPSGRAIFEWSELNTDTDTITLVARTRALDGSFQPVQVLSRFSQDRNTPPIYSDLAVAPRGDAVICWLADGAIHARTRAPGGALGPARTIATKQFGVVPCRPGIDAQGNVVLAWEAPVGSKNRVFTRSLDPAGQLDPTRAVSPAGHNAHPPVLDMTAAGAAAVAWSEGGRGFAIQASFGP